MTTRRDLLKSALAASALTIAEAPFRAAFAKLPTSRRFVVIILRGALDGLAAVPPYADPDYKSVRANLALDQTGPLQTLNLDGFFALHPALTTLHEWYTQKQALIVHDIASPYRDRSHFDGQNVLESGATKPNLLQSGWLNRALTPLGLSGQRAVAVSATVPLMLEGKAAATTWTPSALPEANDAFLKQVALLYAGDPLLKSALAEGLKTEAEANAGMDDVKPGMKPGMGLGGYGALEPGFGGAGHLLAQEDGARIAVLDASGWDTHVNEGGADGQLARRLADLDKGLAALKASLGPHWSETAIVMATEFGRTAHPNGNGGTDHGTGGAAFVMGGAVAGGRVEAKWRGLKPGALRDARDLPGSTDLRSLFKGLLSEHLGVATAALNGEVFPDSANAAAMKGVVRA